MNAIGGRTMWYCATCGGALSVGRSTCSCGGKGLPEEILMTPRVSEGSGPIAKVWRATAKAIGWWDGAP
jgi:hypothetical protein